MRDDGINVSGNGVGTGAGVGVGVGEGVGEGEGVAVGSGTVGVGRGHPVENTTNAPAAKTRIQERESIPMDCYLASQAIAVNNIQIPLRTIIGIAGIGFFLTAYDRPKWTSNKTETRKPSMNARAPGGSKPAIIRSAPLTPPAISDALLFARA